MFSQKNQNLVTFSRNTNEILKLIIFSISTKKNINILNFNQYTEKNETLVFLLID